MRDRKMKQKDYDKKKQIFKLKKSKCLLRCHIKSIILKIEVGGVWSAYFCYLTTGSSFKPLLSTL